MLEISRCLSCASWGRRKARLPHLLYSVRCLYSPVIKYVISPLFRRCHISFPVIQSARVIRTNVVREANMATTVSNPQQVKDMLSSLLQESPSGQEENTIDTRFEGGGFQPRNRKAFLDRAKSFTNATWAGKPVDLSPLHCARYGWRNTNNDELRCVSCYAMIFAGVPDDWDCDFYHDTCVRIRRELFEKHEKVCPWPENPSPLHFTHLPILSREQWRQTLKDTFCGLLDLGGDLPAIDTAWDDLQEMVDGTYLQELHTLASYTPQSDAEQEWAKHAAVLSMTGWNASNPVIDDPSIECHSCWRQIGLWNYLNLKSNSSRLSRMSSIDVRDDSLRLLDETNNTSNNEDAADVSQTQLFAEPNQPPPTQQNLMRDLLFSEGFNPQTSHSRCGESIISEVGSDMFDKRVQSTIDDLSNDVLVSDPIPPPAPTMKDQNFMKELLLLTAPKAGSPPPSESILSDIGSSVFDRRIGSSINSPRAGTPTGGADDSEAEAPLFIARCVQSEVRAKRRRLERDMKPGSFHIIDEHHDWCPWVVMEETGLASPVQPHKCPGYKRVVAALMPSPSPIPRQEAQESPDLAWKSVRRILKDCYSPAEERPSIS